MNSKALRKQLLAAVAMVIVAAIAVSSSTFAWFVNNTKVTAENVSVTATAASTLLIRADSSDSWKTVLPLDATVATMVPVSTVGSDGTTLAFVKDNAWTTDAADDMSYASGFTTATAGTDYYKGTFQIKSSVAGSKLYLDDETTFTMGTYDHDGDAGTPEVPYDDDVLSTLRLGLVVSDGTAKKTFIYQIESTALATAYDTSINAATAVNGITYAIDNTGARAAMNVDNAAAIGEPPLATTPASNTAFVTTTNSADLLYTFANADDVVDVEAYIWMEGCDYDCNAAMVSTITAQTVLTNLGFAVAQS